MQRLAIIATGGTIAMSGKGGDGGRLALSGADIVRAAPYLATIAEVEVHDTLSAPSASFDIGDLARIAAVAETRRAADGIVITHGTDTMEETAFAMACLTAGDPPSSSPAPCGGSTRPVQTARPTLRPPPSPRSRQVRGARG